MSITTETALSSIATLGVTTTSTKAIQEITELGLSGDQYRSVLRDAIQTEYINPNNLDDLDAEYTLKYLVQELVRGQNDLSQAVRTARNKASAMTENVTNGKRQFVLAKSEQNNQSGASSKPKKVKKKDQAEQMYKENKDELTRKQMIDKFVSEIGMTKAGASTYYHNCKKKFED